MERDQFISLMDRYGDAQVFIRSANSNKMRYNVVTTDLDNPYIAERSKNRGGKVSVLPGRILTYAWDQDDFRQIDPATVVKVVPLSEAIERATRSGRG